MTPTFITSSPQVPVHPLCVYPQSPAIVCPVIADEVDEDSQIISRNQIGRPLPAIDAC
jgi:hypothetical protein